MAGVSERVKLADADRIHFFNLIRRSSDFVGWKTIEEQLNCGNTTLKSWRKGGCLLSANAFRVLLSYLELGARKRFEKLAVFLPNNWGAVDAGNRSILKLRARLGEDGFRRYLCEVRSKRENKNPNFLRDWNRKQKAENPLAYKAFRAQMKEKFLARLRENHDSYLKKRRENIESRYGSFNFYVKNGLEVAKKQPLTKREVKVLQATELPVGFTVQKHVTFAPFNVDFAYFKGEKLAAVEEVLGFKKNKSTLFFELLILNEKFKHFQKSVGIPFMVATWFEEKASNRIHRFPLDLALWCLEKGMIPIFLDISAFQQAKIKILNSEFTNNDFRVLKSFLEQMIFTNFKRLKTGAESQLKQSFNLLEQKTDFLLKEKGLTPTGKKLIKTRFNTFLVTDNFLAGENKPAAIFVSKQMSGHLIGSAALVKELTEEKLQTFCVTETEPSTILRPVSKLLFQKYIDKYYPSMTSFSGETL